MKYLEFAEIYEKLSSVSGKLEKSSILADFLKKLKELEKPQWLYLLRGSVVPEYDSREFGVSKQLTIKSLEKTYGVKSDEIVSLLNKMGDIGLLAQELAEKRRQKGLFNSKLETGKVFENLHKIFDIEGKGAVDRKISLISELLSQASGLEAKYIVRTLLADLRIGVAGAILIEALAEAFYKERKDEMKKRLQEAYDLSNDFVLVFQAASKGSEKVDKIELIPGRPVNPMLAVKVLSIEEAFESFGNPVAFEYKYDGFRLMVHKKNNEILLFTRKLENVTKQFPDIVEAVRAHVRGDSFILDSEAVGFDKKTGKYRPFEAVSQRIKRKYDVERLIHELPVEVNVFDVLYLNGKNLMNEKFIQRRKILEGMVKTKERVIKPSEIKIVDSIKDAEKFYKKALEAGEEGIMIKKLDAEYQQGRKVGFMAKLKPEVKDLDLVITAAEYGTGKRAGWLTSYYVACRSEDGLLEVGKVSSGLKEKEEEGTTYEEITKILKQLKIKEEGNKIIVKPKTVVSVTYQNIQKSPEYSSEYALRFPRITNYRPDRGTGDIASLKDIEKAAKSSR